jgi:hypothetical protein
LKEQVGGLGSNQMEPTAALGSLDRRDLLRPQTRVNLCITRGCAQGIEITDSSILPMEEREGDPGFDPARAATPGWWRRGRSSDAC